MLITISTRKGGAGKSSIAGNLAAAYATRGHSVLVLDLDVQGDVSYAYGIDESGEALARAIAGRTPLQDGIIRTDYGVDLAPGGDALARCGENIRHRAIGAMLRPVRRRYDIVVIDCAPALDNLAASAWTAAVSLGGLTIAPVDGPKALRAYARIEHAWEDLRLDTSRLRLVLTRYDERRVLDRDLARQARARHPDRVLRQVIRESVVVRESTAWQEPLLTYAPHHPVTADFAALASEVYHG